MSELHIFKKNWGGRGELPPGPWRQEGNLYRLYCGPHPCLIKRNYMGVLCGYVGLRPGRPLFGVDRGFNDFDDLPEVHGGWTFAALDQGLDEIVDDKGLWWFGFDCAHAMDLVPVWVGLDYGEYRTVEYVRAELERVSAEFEVG